MTTNEFQYYIKCGLGRGIKLLRAEADKSPFREIVFSAIAYGQDYHVMGDSYTDYDLDLIESFDDSSKFKVELSSKILQNIEAGFFYQNTDTLLALGMKDEHKKSCSRCYDTFFAKVSANLKNNDLSSEAGATLRKFFYVCDNLIRYMDRDGITDFLNDLIRLNIPIDSPEFIIPYAVNWLKHISRILGDREADDLLNEISSTHPNGYILDNILKHARSCYGSKQKSSHSYDMSIDEICAEPTSDVIETYHAESRVKHISFIMSSDEVTRQVAERLVSEADIRKRTWMLSLFSNSLYLYEEKLYHLPLFPLGVEKLIEMLGDVKWDVSISKDIPNYKYKVFLLNALSRFRHPKVKALKDILLKENDTIQFNIGVSILLKNYSKDDRDLLVSLLTDYVQNDMTSKNRHIMLINSFISAAEEGIPNLPLDILPSLWNNIPDSYLREKALNLILQNKLMTKELREECLYDCNVNIRKAVNDGN